MAARDPALKKLGRCLALAAAVTFPAPAAVSAQPRDRPEKGGRLFPAGLLYAPYLADPREVRFGVSLHSFEEARIADTGDLRWLLEMGGRFGILRLDGRGGRAWQIDFTAGFRGQFDVDHSQDNLGWDGIYGLALTGDLGGGWQILAGLHHVSSHVGDELRERTGRRRIGYTREELLLAVSRSLPSGLRLYASAGYDPTDVNNDFQQPGRAQAGLELVRPLGPGRWQWYAAGDLTAFEEHDGDPGLALAAGWRIPTGDRAWRLGIGVYDGPVPIGELTTDSEREVFAGVWLDL